MARHNIILQTAQEVRGEKATRLWQGCPALARTGKRLWAAAYTGGDCEPRPDNYCVLLYSDDGRNWIDPYLVIRSESIQTRPIDAQLFADPSGRLWLVWGETKNDSPNAPALYHDGVFGVWASICEDPTAESPRFSQPKRLCNGFMRNKPVFLKNGHWAMCAYDFISDWYSIYISKDKGESWEYLRGPKKPEKAPHPDEAMLIEKKDGALWFTARTRKGIAQSFSFDRGATWTDLENPAIPNPASRFYIGRLTSGNLLMINHVGFTGRSHLTALVSEDDGISWKGSLLIDGRANVSYPDADQDDEGRVWMIHDRERTKTGELLISSFTEEEIISRELLTADSFLGRMISVVNLC
jgi:hypothetical protein